MHMPDWHRFAGIRRRVSRIALDGNDENYYDYLDEN